MIAIKKPKDAGWTIYRNNTHRFEGYILEHFSYGVDRPTIDEEALIIPQFNLRLRR